MNYALHLFMSSGILTDCISERNDSVQYFLFIGGLLLKTTIKPLAAC